jgi:hypothetical protein
MFLQPAVWGEGVVSILAPPTVYVYVCMCVCPCLAICLLSLRPTSLGLMSLAWCQVMKDVTQRQPEELLPPFLTASRTEKGWPSPPGTLGDVVAGPHPDRVMCDPQVGEGKLLPWWLGRIPPG